jgi:DNA-binding NarL/FixJ family response regulator
MPERKAARSILVVEGRQLVRECLANWIQDAVAGAQVFQAAALDALPFRFGAGDPSSEIHLMLISLVGLDLSDWIDSQSGLETRHQQTPFVLMGEYASAEAIRKAINAGARGYIPSSLGMRVATEALKLILAGGTYLPPALLDAKPEPFRPNFRAADGAPPSQPANDDPQTDLLEFTPRERDVLQALVEGKPNKLIAYELNLKESTVKVHVRHIMRKLNVTNRTQVAVQLGPLLRR